MRSLGIRDNFRPFFTKRFYTQKEHPEDLISSEMNKVKFFNLRLKSNDKNHNMKGIPLVVTYHPLLKFLSAIITKNLSILHINKEVKKVFFPATYGFIS